MDLRLGAVARTPTYTDRNEKRSRPRPPSWYRSAVPFSKFGLHPDLLLRIRELGFTRPPPIQEQAIPPAMAGSDVLACAMTGSGKSAAFLLPVLHRLRVKPRGTTRALVVTPTRELAAQIRSHLEE